MSEPHDAVLVEEPAGALGMLDVLVPIARHLRLLLIAPVLAGLVALGVTYAIAPTFTARTSFLPPQQQQSAMASAVQSLGALSNLVGASAMKSPAEQYVSLMLSETVADRIIGRFDLMRVYDAQYRFQARQALAKRVRIGVGKKDGLVTIEVDDEDPKRAASMANQYIEELRGLTNRLALTEAQQRRAFFDTQLTQTRDNLAKAQSALQASGFSQGTLRAEPKSAAEIYARLRAEVTAAEVRLQALRSSLLDSTPEVQQQLATLGSLRARLAALEASGTSSQDPDYIGKYREFKYQEALFELFAKQYEMARLDESREGALIQVVDTALPPEHKSKPQRAVIALITMVASFFVLLAMVLVRHAIAQAAARPGGAERLAEIKSALRLRRG